MHRKCGAARQAVWVRPGRRRARAGARFSAYNSPKSAPNFVAIVAFFGNKTAGKPKCFDRDCPSPLI